MGQGPEQQLSGFFFRFGKNNGLYSSHLTMYFDLS